MFEAVSNPLFGIESIRRKFFLNSDVLCPVESNESSAYDQNVQHATTNKVKNGEVVYLYRFPELLVRSVVFGSK